MALACSFLRVVSRFHPYAPSKPVKHAPNSATLFSLFAFLELVGQLWKHMHILLVYN